jgi:Tfp pilus assembly protein FimT
MTYTSRQLPPRRLGRAGFTTLELVSALGVVVLLTIIGIPKFRETLVRERMRGALRAVAMHVAVARETAVARGCITTLHFTGGSDARAWVTSCKTVGAGVDTVGSVDPFGSRFGVNAAVSTDSVRFNPAGLRVEYQMTLVALSIPANGLAGTVAINQLGRATVSQ